MKILNYEHKCTLIHSTNIFRYLHTLGNLQGTKLLYSSKIMQQLCCPPWRTFAFQIAPAKYSIPLYTWIIGHTSYHNEDKLLDIFILSA